VIVGEAGVPAGRGLRHGRGRGAHGGPARAGRGELRVQAARAHAAAPAGRGEIGDLRFVQLNAVEGAGRRRRLARGRGARPAAARSSRAASTGSTCSRTSVPQCAAARGFRAGDPGARSAARWWCWTTRRRRRHAAALVGDPVAAPRPAPVAPLRHRRLHRVRVERALRGRLRPPHARAAARPVRPRRLRAMWGDFLRALASRLRAPDDPGPRALGTPSSCAPPAPDTRRTT
jgi:hypothetical protein